MSASFLPTLNVSNATAAINFYQRAFNAQVQFIVGDAGSGVVAGLIIDGVEFVVADELPAYGNPSPHTLNGTPVRLGLLVDNPDALAAQALNAGATEGYPVADQPYGYRLGLVIDPFGHRWEIARRL